MTASDAAECYNPYPNGFFADSNTSPPSCFKCSDEIDDCEKCESDTECTKCKESFILSDD